MTRRNLPKTDSPVAANGPAPEWDERSGIHRTPTAAVSPRGAALTFMDGVQQGWGLHHLVTWIDQCLVRPGRLITRHAFPRIIIRETNIGALSFGAPDNREDAGSFLEHSRAPELLKWARRAVVEALEGMLRTSPDDRFVQAALYDGRVTRVQRARRGRTWDVMLTEDHALSQQVLALFAADLLERRDDYEQQLVICGTCERVDFWPERVSRRGCPQHAEAVLSTRARTSGFGT